MGQGQIVIDVNLLEGLEKVTAVEDPKAVGSQSRVLGPAALAALVEMQIHRTHC